MPGREAVPPEIGAFNFYSKYRTQEEGLIFKLLPSRWCTQDDFSLPEFDE